MDQYQINYKTAVEIDLSRDVRMGWKGDGIKAWMWKDLLWEGGEKGMEEKRECEIRPIVRRGWKGDGRKAWMWELSNSVYIIVDWGRELIYLDIINLK